ncbi:MAG: DUF3995 domain-containing protein [Ktedonobacterales bacterium]
MACGWAFIFAAVSFYWAAGGTVGSETIGPAITGLAHDPVFIAILWLTGALKVVAGLLALAFVQPWGRMIPRWMLLTAAWIAFVIMALYEGAASWVQHGLMAAGGIGIPSGLGTTALYWHLLLWDPWWLAGGILFGALALSYQRRSREPGASVAHGWGLFHASQLHPRRWRGADGRGNAPL